jgi:hypothetical protein
MNSKFKVSEVAENNKENLEKSVISKNNHIYGENNNFSSQSDSLKEDEENIFIIDSSTDSPKKKNTIKDFEISFLLGKGSYAKVVLAKNIYTNKLYSLKVIDKGFLANVRKYQKKILFNNSNMQQNFKN